jgi:hypothetical protein
MKKLTAKQKALQKEWETLLSKWDKVPKFSRSNVKVKKTPSSLTKTNFEERKTLMTPGGSTALKPKQVYTGSAIVGLATLHKSCIQPVFSKEAAIEVSQMRRN